MIDARVTVDADLVNDLAVEWNTKLLKQKSCVFVATGCGVNCNV